MTTKKEKTKLVRVGMNLPETIVNQVKEYADSLGVNTTSAYIFLLNQALQQKEAFSNFPAMVAMFQELKQAQLIQSEMDGSSKK